MLRFEKLVPEGAQDGAPLLVLLHGRGSDRFDLLRLGPLISPEAVIVTPEAPYPGMPWGYGPGWAWYRFLGGNTPEPDSFEQSQCELETFLAGLPAQLPVRTGPLALGGFSQGGTLSIAHALRNPGAVPLVLNFSGFLADHPSVRVTPETVRYTRFFWGHGTQDPSIPFALGVEGRAALRAASADLEARDYPIGHEISAQEARDAGTWLERNLAMGTSTPIGNPLEVPLPGWSFRLDEVSNGHYVATGTDVFGRRVEASASDDSVLERVIADAREIQRGLDAARRTGEP